MDVAELAQVLKAAVWSLPFSVLAGAVVGGQFLASGGWIAAGVGLVAGAAVFAASVGATLLLTGMAGWAVRVTGSSTPGEPEFSYEKSLVERGLVERAIASYEAHIRDNPAASGAYLELAELQNRRREPRRAAALFAAARSAPGSTEAQRLYATNRLIDLYSGALEAPDAARQELHRLVAEFPGSRAAVHARLVLERGEADADADSGG